MNHGGVAVSGDRMGERRTDPGQYELNRNPRRRGCQDRGNPTFSGVPPEIAARICRLRADGMSYAQIAATLNAEQVPTAQGGAAWHPPTVRKIALRESEAVAA